MNFDAKAVLDNAIPWLEKNWQIVAAIFVALVVLSILRSLFSRSPRTASPASSQNTAQALDTALAAGAEVNADLEAYARTLFSEDFLGHAQRITGDAPRPVRFATIGEAPFVYDGVIMRDIALLPSRVIAPVSAHFRQGQNVLDAMRRLGSMNPPDATARERLDALRATVNELQSAIDKAADAAEKLDGAISKAGGTLTVSRSLLDLGTDVFKGFAVDRPGQRAKFYRAMRDQSAARVKDILASIDTVRVTTAASAMAVEPVTKDMRPAAE